MKNKRILMINPGPTYNASDNMFQEKFILLSKYFGGYFFTSSSKVETIPMDKILYKSIVKNRYFGNLKYLIECLRFALELRKKDKIDCIITYDPLKTGIIGLICKYILKAKLIVEVNGVYTSNDNWADKALGFMGKVKLLIAPIIMRYVISAADGVKLLFPGQVDGIRGLKMDTHFAVFPSWISVSHFKNVEEKKEVLFVGFPFHRKGVDVLIQSFKLVAHRYPDWSLKIMGYYPDKTLLDDEIGGHAQIFYHPPVLHSEISKHVGECGIFVLPSRTEAMGRVLLESAAAGKPRIGSNVDGIPTVINDGVDGFLVEPGDVQALAEKMSLLMGDSGLRKRLGSAGAERVNGEFSERQYVENYHKFIMDVFEV